MIRFLLTKRSIELKWSQQVHFLAASRAVRIEGNAGKQRCEF